MNRNPNQREAPRRRAAARQALIGTERSLPPNPLFQPEAA
jgi:hypothetical protein